MNRPVRVQLRVLLVLMFLLILLAQAVLFPTMGAEMAASFPEYAHLLVPYVSVVVCGLACVQIAVLAAWCLVGMTVQGRPVTPRALAGATVMAAASGTATLLAVLLAWHLFEVVQQGNPATLFGLGSAVITGTAMTVMSLRVRGRLGASMETGTGTPAPDRGRGNRV